KLFPNIAIGLKYVPQDQPGDFSNPQSSEVGQDQGNSIPSSMLALRHYGKQALEFGVGEHSGLAHGNLTKGRDWPLFMMLPLSLSCDRRLQITRKPKERGRPGRFREPNKIYIL